MSNDDRAAKAAIYLPQMRMDFPTIESKAKVAEEAGFHSVWFMDHMAPPAARQHEMLEAWTVATGVAVRTERIHVGHLVLANEFRHPVTLAKMAASLDVMSGGRLELGLGWGSVEQEFTDYGFGAIPRATRAARLAETIEIMQALWTGEPVSVDGQHWQLHDAICRPVPVRGRVPIHIGGAGARLTLPLVDRYADWWNCPSTAIDRMTELRPLIGSTRISMQHPIGIAPSTTARDEVVALTQKRFGGWGGVVAGTPDEVAAALRRERDAGAELFICQFHDFGTPESIRLFADEVLPALAD